MDFLFSFSLVLSHLSSFISYLNNFSNLLGFEKLVLPKIGLSGAWFLIFFPTYKGEGLVQLCCLKMIEFCVILC